MARKSKRRKPSFFVIGASKAGTTSFCEMLEQHPEVGLTRPTEPNFFSVHYDKGWAWYAQRFPDPNRATIFGEKSPTYTHRQRYPDVPRRIRAAVPDARLIYVVRNPIARIESRWMQDRASGLRQDFNDFNSAVRKNLHGIVDTTCYLQQIEAFRQFFPDEQIQVVFFKDLVSQPATTMARSFEFVGVEPNACTVEFATHTNQSAGKLEDGRLLRQLRRLLPKDTRRMAVPQFARRVARSLLKRPVTSRPRWEQSTLDWLIDELGSETAEFLRRYRGNEEYWDLSPRVTARPVATETVAPAKAR